MIARVAFVALCLASATLFGASVNDSRAPAAVDQTTASQAVPATSVVTPTRHPEGRLPTADPERPLTGFTASTPFVAPDVAALPLVDAQSRIALTPTVTPSATPERPECDPAYPDERTCIPPGPPFARGCAITTERRFTVLPPDPQRLDHDADGIGCEPIR